MYKIISLIMLVWFGATSEEMVVLTTANMRSAPTINSEIVKTVSEGVVVKVISASDSYDKLLGMNTCWAFVESEGIKGWIYAGLLGMGGYHPTNVLIDVYTIGRYLSWYANWKSSTPNDERIMEYSIDVSGFGPNGVILQKDQKFVTIEFSLLINDKKGCDKNTQVVRWNIKENITYRIDGNVIRFMSNSQPFLVLVKDGNILTVVDIREMTYRNNCGDTYNSRVFVGRQLKPFFSSID